MYPKVLPSQIIYKDPQQITIKKKSFMPENEAELRYYMKKSYYQEDDKLEKINKKRKRYGLRNFQCEKVNKMPSEAEIKKNLQYKKTIRRFCNF
jgi:hypothetical protein